MFRLTSISWRIILEVRRFEVNLRWQKYEFRKQIIIYCCHFMIRNYYYYFLSQSIKNKEIFIQKNKTSFIKVFFFFFFTLIVDTDQIRGVSWWLGWNRDIRIEDNDITEKNIYFFLIKKWFQNIGKLWMALHWLVVNKFSHIQGVLLPDRQTLRGDSRHGDIHY